MNKIVVFSALMFVFFLRLQGFAQVEAVSIDRFEELKNNGYTVIDVRTQEEFGEGYIQGAQLYNYIDPEFKNRISTLDKAGNYVLYCRSGNRSTKAGNIMKEMGFKNVYSLDGGIDAWKKAGKPVVK